MPERIGVSVNTVRWMESGHPGTCVQHLARALQVFGELDKFEKLMGIAQDSVGAWACRLLDHGCLLFRWRSAEMPAHHFAQLQKRIRARLELGSTQIECSRTANTCTNPIKI